MDRHGPVVLGGLCTGAVLALRVAARGGVEGIRGLALLSPLLAYAVACATSAVAIAEAAAALRRGEVDMALAGGAEALLVPGAMAAWHALRTLAPPHDGDVGRSCRSR